MDCKSLCGLLTLLATLGSLCALAGGDEESDGGQVLNLTNAGVRDKKLRE